MTIDNLSRTDLSLLRGIREISLTPSIPGKVIWTVILLGLLGLSSYQIYTKVTLSTNGDSANVLVTDSKPYSFPQVTLCLDWQAYIRNRKWNTALYTKSFYSNTNFLWLYLTLNQYLQLEKDILKAFNMKVRPEYLFTSYKHFRTLTSFDLPVQKLSFDNDIMNLKTDFLLDCQYTDGSKCNISDVIITKEFRDCIQIRAPTGSLTSTKDVPNEMVITLRLNKAISDPLSSSVTDYKSGLTAYVHEDNAIDPIGNRVPEYGLEVNYPGIYDIRFMRKEGKLTQCDSSADSKLQEFLKPNDLGINTTRSYIRDSETCLQRQLSISMTEKCNCLAAFLPIDSGQKNWMTKFYQTYYTVGQCHSPVNNIIRSTSLFDLGVLTTAYSNRGIWNSFIANYTWNLIEAMRGRWNITNFQVQTYINVSRTIFPCMEQVLQPYLDKPKGTLPPECSKYVRCLSLNYSINYDHYPMPFLTTQAISQLSAIITKLRLEKFNKTSLNGSWDSVPDPPTVNYFKEDLAVLKIKPNKKPRAIMKQPAAAKMGTAQLLLDIGMILAVFLGFSVMSVFEFFDVIISLIFCRKDKSKVSQQPAAGEKDDNTANK